MRTLVTGKSGFLAKNVIEFFKVKGHDVFAISHTDDDVILRKYCKKCDFIFHLAAVQRSQYENDFWQGNVEYTKKLLRYLEEENNYPAILFTTSTGIDKESYFSASKIAAEKLIREFGERHQCKVYIYKLNHIFGKYGKPNYNNVVSTFCYNIAKNIPLKVSDDSVKLNLTYVDDLLIDFYELIQSNKMLPVKYAKPSKVYGITLGELAYKLSNIENEPYDELLEKLKLTIQYYGDKK